MYVSAATVGLCACDGATNRMVPMQQVAQRATLLIMRSSILSALRGEFQLRDGNLRSKYDVIIFPHVGGSAVSQVNGMPKTGNAPLPYKKTAEFPNLAYIDSSDDIRGGMGIEGLGELMKFVQEGGTLITEGSTATIFPEYGITAGITVEEPAQLFVRGSILRAKITDMKSPIAYGYESADLPVPALVNFDTRPGADLKAIEQRVQAISPAAQVSAHRDRVSPLLRSMREIQWLAFGLVLLLSAAATAAVVLAARGALDTHRFTIEVMHGIGATDEQVTQLFQRKIAIDALVGSLGGAAAGALVLLGRASGASFAGGLVDGATLGAIDFLILLLLPFALTALATWVARRAVLTALRETL